jgi:hypothetical protein
MHIIKSMAAAARLFLGRIHHLNDDPSYESTQGNNTLRERLELTCGGRDTSSQTG